jgi:hypothetical protein
VYSEENRANFSEALDGKLLFSALYSMYTLTLNELNAVLKVSVQACLTVVVNKIIGIKAPGQQLPGSKEVQESYL